MKKHTQTYLTFHKLMIQRKWIHFTPLFYRNRDKDSPYPSQKGAGLNPRGAGLKSYSPRLVTCLSTVIDKTRNSAFGEATEE